MGDDKLAMVVVKIRLVVEERAAADVPLYALLIGEEIPAAELVADDQSGKLERTPLEFALELEAVELMLEDDSNGEVVVEVLLERLLDVL